MPLACDPMRVADGFVCSRQSSRGAFPMHAAVRRLPAWFPLIFLLVSALATLAHAAPVLMISIDGLKPEYVTQADAHGMKIPYLRTLIARWNLRGGGGGHLADHHLSQPHHAAHGRVARRARHLLTTRSSIPSSSSAARGTGMPRRFACPRCGRRRTRPACARPASAGR